MLGGSLLRGVGVLGELGNGGDFAVEVVGKGVLEGTQDAKQLVAREVVGAFETAKVLFKFGQTGQECLCDGKLVVENQ